jgi:hypothetical protein
MELSIGTIIGQLIGLLFVAVIIYFIALIPISFKRIASELAEIKAELKKRNGKG